MRPDEQLKELAISQIERIAEDYRQKLTITTQGVWITATLSNDTTGVLCTVKARGYKNALDALGDWIKKNLLHHE